MSENANSIRALRERCKLSLSQLAERAKVSHTTISRWEKGQTSPDWQTAYAVVKILLETEAQADAWMQAHLDRPSSKEKRAFWIPTAGELWKDLRIRRGITPSALAQHLGLSYSQVNRWENGFGHPPNEILPRLFDTLRAYPEERAALSKPGYLVLGDAEPCASVEDVEWRLEMVRRGVMGEGDYPSALALLCLYRDISRFAATNPHALPFRAGVCQIYAQYLSRYGQSSLRLEWIELGLRLIKPGNVHMGIWAGLIFHKGYAQENPRKQAAVLERELPHMQGRRDRGILSQALREIAKCRSHHRAFEEARFRAGESLRLAVGTERPEYIKGSRLALAQIEIRAGKASAAFPLLPPLPPPGAEHQDDEHPDVYGAAILLKTWTQAYFADRQRGPAEATLQRLLDFAGRYNLKQHVSEAQDLARLHRLS